MGQDNASDSCNAVASKAEYEYAWKLVHGYFTILTIQPLTTTEAAIRSIYFATRAPVSLCIEFDQQQEYTFTPTEIPKLAQPEEVVSIPEPQADEENQTEDVVSPIEEPRTSKEELPETSEVDIPKIHDSESIVIQSIPVVASPHKSTPRRRLSVAKQLDIGLNKNREPAKRPTMVTRVAVQPKHKSVVDNVTSTVSGTEFSDTPAQQQEHDKQASNKTSAKDSRKRLVSRQKEKLFDAIRRSFSRSKKTSLV